VIVKRFLADTAMRGERSAAPTDRFFLSHPRARLAFVGRPSARVLSYILPSLLAALVVQSWFSPGRFIATGDVGPFVRISVAHEMDSSWGHQYTGAGSPSYQAVARAPEVGLLATAHALGASDETAQRWFYSLLIVALALSAVFFAFAFVESALIASIAGLLAVFNPFVLQLALNPLIPWGLAIMGFSGGLIVRAARQHGASPIALAVVSAFGVYLLLNPPLLLLAAMWVVGLAASGSLIGGPGGTKRALLLLARAAPWILLFDLWWLVPFASTLLQRDVGQAFSAETSPQAWSFTQTRTSIGNVLSLSSFWGWSFPEYFPYAAKLDAPLWSPLRFALPMLALSAPLVTPKDRRQVPLLLLSFSLVIVFLSKGLHGPLAGLNEYLYEHVPGMWLLREPNTKLGLPLLLLYVASASIALSEIVTRARSARAATSQALFGLSSVLVIWCLAYPYPLWTGQVAPQQRPILPSARVQIPEGWHAIANFINRSPDRGKVLLLPVNDYYQIPTTWGYYGEDDVPRWLFDRPAIQLLPKEYFEDLPGFSSIVRSFQTALASGDATGAGRLLEATGASYVVLRKDIVTDFPGRNLVAPGRLERTLTEIPGLQLVLSEGVGNVYRLDGVGGDAVKAYSSLVSATGGPGSLPSGIATMSSAAVVSTFGGAADGEKVYISRPGSPAFSFSSSAGPYVLAQHPLGDRLYLVDRSAETTGRWHLDFHAASGVNLDGQSLDAGDEFKIPVDQEPIALRLNGTLYPLTGEEPAVPLTPNPRPELYGRASEPAHLSVFGPAGDCNLAVRKSRQWPGMNAEPLSAPQEVGVRVTTTGHPACTTSPVAATVPAPAYLVSFSYRTLEGATAGVCFFQRGPDACAPLPPLSSGGAWQTFEGVAATPSSTTGLELALFAPSPPAGGRSVAEFRSVEVSPLERIGSLDIPQRPYLDRTVELAAGVHRITTDPLPATSLLPASRVADCNKLDARTLAQTVIESRRLPSQPPPALQLRANAHSACVSWEVTPTIPGATYRVGLDYRTVTGDPARVCAWQDGPGFCAAESDLNASPTWQHYEQTFVLDPRTTALRLFVYADAGAGAGVTETEYRNVKVELAPTFTLTAIPSQSDLLPPPAIHWSQTGPATYDVYVPATPRRFTLVLAESYARGWQLDGLPPGRDGAHVLVDGYANGWRISPGSGISLSISYSPDGWTRGARDVSILAGGLAVVMSLAHRRRRSRRDRTNPEG
jgi:arabinofuranan 3-O-arabinosyltransferase